MKPAPSFFFRGVRRVVLLTAVGLMCHPCNAQVINVPDDTAPSSIGSGQTLNLFEGGALPEFFSVRSGAVLNIFGGEIAGPSELNGGFFGAVGSEINFFSGNTGGAEYGSEGVLNLYGGNPGDFAILGGETNITGGNVGRNATIEGVVNLSGGVLQNNLLGLDTGVLNILGRSLAINGEAVVALSPGVAFPVASRGVTIAGDLFDGTPFELDLFNPTPGDVLTPGFVQPGFTVNFLLTVPEPSTAAIVGLALAGYGVRKRASSSKCT